MAGACPGSKLLVHKGSGELLCIFPTGGRGDREEGEQFIRVF